MTCLCLWNTANLEYDGLCTHSSLAETDNLQDFELTEAERVERGGWPKKYIHHYYAETTQGIFLDHNLSRLTDTNIITPASYQDLP